MDKSEERIKKAKRYEEFEIIKEHQKLWSEKSFPPAIDISEKFGHSLSTSYNILREYKKVFNK